MGSIFFAQTDALIVQCFDHSTYEKFKKLMLNEFANETETLGYFITIKNNRDDCFEKIIGMIEKLRAINKNISI